MSLWRASHEPASKSVRKVALLSTIVLLLLVAPTGVYAQTTYFGEDLWNSQDVPIPSHPNADAAMQSFFANRLALGTQTFEGLPNWGVRPSSLTFGSVSTATFTGVGYVVYDALGQTYRGRTPTSGVNFLESGGTFHLSLSQPAVAFGFYGLDVGDLGGLLTLTLHNPDFSWITTTLTVPYTVGDHSTSGSVFYYGFVDEANPFIAIDFNHQNAGLSLDAFGFDDISIGEVPEPSAFLLAGLGAATIMIAGQRRRLSPPLQHLHHLKAKKVSVNYNVMY